MYPEPWLPEKGQKSPKAEALEKVPGVGFLVLWFEYLSLPSKLRHLNLSIIEPWILRRWKFSLVMALG